MKWIKRLITVIVVVVGGIYLLVVCPIPPRRLVTTMTSPDGKEVATFYWKPAGLLGAISKDNPWVCAEIRDTGSDRLIFKQWTSGDTPDDGLSRFSGVRPWVKTTK